MSRNSPLARSRPKVSVLRTGFVKSSGPPGGRRSLHRWLTSFRCRMTVPTHDSPYDDVLARAVRAARRGAALIRDRSGELDQDAGHDVPVDGTRWIVDPIDGTTNFIQQVPPYAVSIALQDEDEIVVG